MEAYGHERRIQINLYVSEADWRAGRSGLTV